MNTNYIVTLNLTEYMFVLHVTMTADRLLYVHRSSNLPKFVSLRINLLDATTNFKRWVRSSAEEKLAMTVVK